MKDLVGKAEKNIRRLDQGAEKVQTAFNEGRLSVKLDPSKGVMNNFIALNAQVTERFSSHEGRLRLLFVRRRYVNRPGDGVRKVPSPSGRD